MHSVLVVDDYADTRELLEAVLADQGYRVFTAVDGEEGLRMAREMHPNAIIMDICMPVMDGLEATSHLKADAATSHSPVIAHTALPSLIPPQQHLFAAICTKPCPPAHLCTVLRDVLAA